MQSMQDICWTEAIVTVQNWTARPFWSDSNIILLFPSFILPLFWNIFVKFPHFENRKVSLSLSLTCRKLSPLPPAERSFFFFGPRLLCLVPLNRFVFPPSDHQPPFRSLRMYVSLSSSNMGKKNIYDLTTYQ